MTLRKIPKLSRGGRSFSLRSHIHLYRYIYACFFISMAILAITYYVKGVYPFGDQTLLRVDLYHQYAPYLEELHRRLLEGGSLLYSWEGGLGKDFVAQMAYYTTSPLNLLMFLFPKEENLPELVMLLIMLKISLSSTSFAWYLRDRRGRDDLSLVPFGLLYGFCAFLTCYYWNIMWLDTVALFPLVAAGVERLLEGRCGLYYAALTLTMIVNFYLAVLVCVITALYFLVWLFCERGNLGSYRACGGKILCFGLWSILAALTSLFILWPVGKALMATAVSDAAFPRFSIYTNIYQFLPQHFLGARPVVLARNEDLPNIYCGVLTMVLLPLYYFNRGIPRKKKVGYSLLLLFLLLCTCIKPLDFLIHGLHFPANLPHRYAFLYSFLLLCMGAEAFEKLQEVKFRWAIAGCIFYAAAILITQFLVVPRIEKIDRVLTNSDIVTNFVLFALYLVLLWLMRKGEKAPGSRLKAIVTFALLACVLFEVVDSSLQDLEDTGLRHSYIKYMGDAPSVIAEMDELEEGNLYRAEFRRFTTINDASLYHYRGFSQFSSLSPGGLSKFMQSLGIASTGNSFRYYDPTPLIDAMFGIKYVMNKDGAHPKASKYDFVSEHGTIWLYKVKRSLPLGFLVDKDLAGWQVGAANPFTVQNDFLHLAAGVSGDMLTPIWPQSLDTEFITTSDTEDGVFSYTVDAPSILSREPSVSAVYTVPTDMYVYLYVDAANAQRFCYRNTTVNEDRELSAGRSLIDVGQMKKGEKLYVDFKLTRRGAFEKSYRSSGNVSLFCASYHDEVFQEGYDRLVEGGYTITSFTDTHLEGVVAPEEEGLLFTSIPWSDGWKVTVDGKEVEKTSIGGGLIGIPLSPGTHVVAFTYRQWILLPALLLSLTGLALSLWLLFFRHRILDDPVQAAKVREGLATDPEDPLIVDGVHPSLAGTEGDGQKDLG